LDCKRARAASRRDLRSSNSCLVASSRFSTISLCRASLATLVSSDLTLPSSSTICEELPPPALAAPPVLGSPDISFDLSCSHSLFFAWYNAFNCSNCWSGVPTRGGKLDVDAVVVIELPEDGDDDDDE
jgi:hypothetical protein